MTPLEELTERGRSVTFEMAVTSMRSRRPGMGKTGGQRQLTATATVSVPVGWALAHHFRSGGSDLDWNDCVESCTWGIPGVPYHYGSGIRSRAISDLPLLPENATGRFNLMPSRS